MVHVLDSLSASEAAILKAEIRRHRHSNPSWHVAIQGNVVQVKRLGMKPPPKRSRKGTKIGVWSMQSRMRLLRYLNKIDSGRIAKSLFVTLTYPDEVIAMEYPLRTMQRSVFMRYVEGYLGRHVPAVWRIEWEERKSGAYTGKLAPHFHLMLFGVDWIPWREVRNMWRKTIHRPSGPLKTWVRRIFNEDGALRYLSKYVSKYHSLDIATYLNSDIKFGNHWGLLRKDEIPLAPRIIERHLSEKEISIVRKFAAGRWKHYNPETDGGFTLLNPTLVKTFTAWLNSSGHDGAN